MGVCGAGIGVCGPGTQSGVRDPGGDVGEGISSSSSAGQQLSRVDEIALAAL